MLKTTLDHLPEGKQRTLAEVRRLISNELEAYIEHKSRYSHSYIVWMVLFGSYARGDYVEDHINGYISDFDILVAVNGRELADDSDLWYKIDEKLERLTRTPVNVIVHTHEEVAQWLKEGQYYFSDIRQDGIYLHTHSGKGLPEPKHLSHAERLPIAEKHYQQWFENANEFLIDGENALGRKSFKKAAFEFHQATERFYGCILLVLSNYRPKTHNIETLRHMAIDMTGANSPLLASFPGNDKFQRRSFQRLKRAYVDARYSEHYEITEEELLWLANEAQQLKDTTQQLCGAHLQTLAGH